MQRKNGYASRRRKIVQPTDRIEFVKILNGLALTKPGAVKLAPEALDLWWSAMQSWNIEEFRTAANHLAMSCEFMPNPYHFAQLRKSAGATVGEAFAKARQICRSLHPREMISHRSGDDRLDAAIRACGGYEALAMCTPENIGFYERRFAEHYETITDASDVRTALPAIGKIAERVRLLNG
jgi:hypothetical protein